MKYTRRKDQPKPRHVETFDELVTWMHDPNRTGFETYQPTDVVIRLMVDEIERLRAECAR